MLKIFKPLTQEQMNAIYGGAQTVEDIDRTRPTK